jgi:hypothetical protein
MYKKFKNLSGDEFLLTDKTINNYPNDYEIIDYAYLLTEDEMKAVLDKGEYRIYDDKGMIQSTQRFMAYHVDEKNNLNRVPLFDNPKDSMSSLMLALGLKWKDTRILKRVKS